MKVGDKVAFEFGPGPLVVGEIVEMFGQEWGDGWVVVKYNGELIEMQQDDATPVIDASVPLTTEMLEEAAMRCMENFGQPRDLYDPESGACFIKDGKVTPEGEAYFQLLRKHGII